METGNMESKDAMQRISETSTLSADVEPFVPRQYQAVPSNEAFLSYEEQSSIPLVPSYITNCYPFVQEEYLRYELPQWAAYVPNAPSQPPFPGMGMADMGPPCSYSQGYAPSMVGKGNRHGRSKTNMMAPSPRSRNWGTVHEGYCNPEAIRAGSDHAYDNSYGRWELSRPPPNWSLGQDQPPVRSPVSSRANSSRRGSRSAREAPREPMGDKKSDDPTSEDASKEGSLSSRGKGPSTPSSARYHSRTLGDFLSHIKTSKKGRPASSGTIRSTPSTERATQSAKSSQRTSHAGFSPGFQIKKSDWPTTEGEDANRVWCQPLTTSPRPKSFADIIKTNNPPKLPLSSNLPESQRIWTPSNFGESEASKTGHFLKQCEKEGESVELDQSHKASHGLPKSSFSPRSALLQGVESSNCTKAEEQKSSSNCGSQSSNSELQVTRCGDCGPIRCSRDSKAEGECCSVGNCKPSASQSCKKGTTHKTSSRKGAKEEEGKNNCTWNDSPRLRPNSADSKGIPLPSSRKAHCSSPCTPKEASSAPVSQRLQENGNTDRLTDQKSSSLQKADGTSVSPDKANKQKKKKKKNSATELNLVKTQGKMVLLTPDLYAQITKETKPKDGLSLRDDNEYPVLGKEVRSPRTPRPKVGKVAEDDDSADWSDMDSDMEHEDRSSRMAKLAELCTRVSDNQKHLGFSKDTKSSYVPSRNESSLSYSAVLKQQKGLNNVSAVSQAPPPVTDPKSLEKKIEKPKKKTKSPPKRSELSGSAPAPAKRVKPKPNAPIHLDFLQMLTAVEGKKKANKKQKMSFTVGGRGREARSGKVFPIVANILDSTAPSRRRGKEREGPVKRHPSALKKVILKEREAKRGQRLKEEERQKQLSGRSSISDTEGEQLVATPQEPVWELTPWSSGGKEENPMVAQSFLHSRRFREYCNHTLKPEIDAVVTILLQDLIRFHNRLYHKDPLKAKSRRRIVLGLREVTKHLKLKKLKCLILAPNLDRIRSKGGLDDVIETILTLAKEQNVPFVFALGRKPLGRVCYKQVPVSCVGIFNYSGSENNFYRLMELVAEAQQEYKRMLDSLDDSRTPPSLSRLDGTPDSAYPDSGVAVATGSTPSTASSSSASSSPPYQSSTVVPRLHLPLV